MRAIELTIFIALVTYLLWISFGSGLPSSLFRYLPFAAAALTTAHWAIEGARWQLVPLYLLVALSLATFPWLRSRSFQIRLSLLAMIWAVSIPFLATTAVTAGTLWPVFSFAPLTGQYDVGVISAHLIDRGRLDPYSSGGSAVRELMVEAWYPAESVNGFKRARYRDGRQSGFKDSQLALVKTRSFLNAPLAKTQPTYPVLIFSGPMNRFQNTFQTEELASHGFIVIGIDHPYDSDLVVFPDGRRVSSGKEPDLPVFTSEDALAASRKRVELRLAVRVADVEYVLNQLEQWNGSSPQNRFFGHLDLAHIAMIGHSFGGAVAAEICKIDARVRAGINLDGSIYGTVKMAGVPKPFFFLFDDNPRPTRAQLETGSAQSRREFRELQADYDDAERTLCGYGGYFFQIRGLQHMNYTDFPLYSRVRAWTGAGAIGARHAHEMINRMSLAFLRRELLGDTAISVEAVAHQHPEAFFIHREPQAQSSCPSIPRVQ
jgi:pimeloyl-ACP methyl ester carboxylesterase